MTDLQVIRTTETACLPTRGTPESAGLDLRADEAALIEPGHRRMISTGLVIALPERHAGLIKPRSGLAVKHGIDVLAGIIDPDYRGVVKVVLINHGDTFFAVQPGDAIAQLLIEPVAFSPAIEVDALDETERAAGGFGHTGR